MEVSGYTYSDGGKGRTTAQMKQPTTFIGWNQSGDWTIDVGSDYPRLAWENAEGTPLLSQEDRYEGGCGSLSDPYRISTADQLAAIAHYPQDFNSCFILLNDIDMNEAIFYPCFPIGSVDAPFTGIIDGQGHTISHFVYDEYEEDYSGLVGYLLDEGSGPSLDQNRRHEAGQVF